MPYCPSCRYEYEPGTAVCPDCNEKLVASLDDITVDKTGREKIYENWIQIARLSSPQFAMMIEDGLRAKNIPVVIFSGTGHFGFTGQMGMSAYRAVGGGYSVMVPREYIAVADKEAGLILGDEWEKSKLLDIM